MMLPLIAGLLATTLNAAPQDGTLQVGGVYPHLAMFNEAEGECGTGAVVPWAGSLWVVTYAPHEPLGSTNKLYQITGDLARVVRPESVGGTPANRLIHRESDQLFIGFHVIDATGSVRTIAPAEMPGRPTGTARHLTAPDRKVYIATMEEGLYEVDVDSLEITCLLRDGNENKGARFFPDAPRSKLPGTHGKGLYSGQGGLFYSNNGEPGARARVDPTTPSGALARWEPGGDWRLLVREQFTEITGPGGIHGAEAETDPIWALGWDHRSVLLNLRDGDGWTMFRLPKASFSYDGAHGWNTEWPRIREIGEGDAFLAIMHGTFWRFPATFSVENTAGIRPRSNYLRVIGDFARWGDRLVFGCDDSAKKEFLNTRPLKAEHAAPLQSNSNLWFVDPARLDKMGPALGSGGVWLNDDLDRGALSDAYLFAGYDHRTLHLWHDSDTQAEFIIEHDTRGDGSWSVLTTLSLAPGGSVSHVFDPSDAGEWIRIRCTTGAVSASAWFSYRDDDPRGTTPAPKFEGLATDATTEPVGGILRGLGSDRRTLGLLSESRDGALTLSEIGADLQAVRSESDELFDAVEQARPPSDIPMTIGEHSILIEENGKRFRLPLNPGRARSRPFATTRAAREVVTERDLLHAGGTFFELPARNAGGVAGIRPVASHPFCIQDFASHRGLTYLTGVAPDATGTRIVRDRDGDAVAWVGVIDEFWELGKPIGRGGPWHKTAVVGGEPSDPYLMHGYDSRRLSLINHGANAVTVSMEADPSGTGSWIPYRSWRLEPGESADHAFPDAYAAHWIRFVTREDGVISAILEYR